MRDLLQLMQLGDSAIPIGAAAHSFGLEALVELTTISASTLMPFVEAFLEEQGLLEACFCRAGYDRGIGGKDAGDVCFAMSALKPARESREASIVLGRRLLGMVQALVTEEQAQIMARGFHAGEPHHAVVFGYVGAMLKMDEEMVVGAFLHQTVTTVVSSAQRLMPVGQRQAAAILWAIKNKMMVCVERSREESVETVGSFFPELEIASMRHPSLETRLFLS